MSTPPHFDDAEVSPPQIAGRFVEIVEKCSQSPEAWQTACRRAGRRQQPRNVTRRCGLRDQTARSAGAGDPGSSSVIRSGARSRLPAVSMGLQPWTEAPPDRQNQHGGSTGPNRVQFSRVAFEPRRPQRTPIQQLRTISRNYEDDYLGRV